MRIELAAPCDLAAIAALDVWLVGRERQSAIVAQSVAAARCYAAFCDANLAGFVTWDREFFNRPFVRLLAVAAAHRRAGIGRALLERVERAVAGEGELFISTETINAPMRAMLTGTGYLPSGSLDRINAPGNPELVYYKRL